MGCVSSSLARRGVVSAVAEDMPARVLAYVDEIPDLLHAPALMDGPLGGSLLHLAIAHGSRRVLSDLLQRVAPIR